MKEKLSKKCGFLILLLTSVLLLCSCGSSDKGQAQPGENEYLVYYLDGTGRALTSEIYAATAPADSAKELIPELLDAMRYPSAKSGNMSTVRKEITVMDTRLNDEVLSVYLSDSYSSLAVEDEVMFRAAYVKTMTQIQGVKYVSFYVNEQPLKDALGNPVGIMLATDFMEDIGSGTYRTWVDLSVYYGNASADRLVPERITIGYGRDASVERVVVEQLIKGPGEENHVRTVPATLTLLSVTTKDGICYVNFDSVLTDEVMPVSPAMTIYSIVNSLCELSNINKVQISVKGSTNILFRDTIDLSQPLERSLDIIETQQN